MTNLAHEFSQLVEKTLSYLDTQPNQKRIFYNQPLTPAPKKAAPLPKPLPQKAKTPTPPPVPIPQKTEAPPPLPKPLPQKAKTPTPPPVPIPQKTEAPPPASFAQLAPRLNHVEAVPDDALAKKIRFSWKDEKSEPTVALLTYGETGPAFLFLKNLTKAITSRLAPAAMMSEREAIQAIEAGTLKWVIAPKTTLHARSEIARYSNRCTLLPLPPIANFEDNLDLKRRLWNRLCETLQQSS